MSPSVPPFFLFPTHGRLVGVVDLDVLETLHHRAHLYARLQSLLSPRDYALLRLVCGLDGYPAMTLRQVAHVWHEPVTLLRQQWTSIRMALRATTDVDDLCRDLLPTLRHMGRRHLTS